MSKKKIYSRHLMVGCFYLHDDSNGGHPSLLYKKIHSKNRYYVIIFTSKPGRKRKKLKHNIDVEKETPSYVHLVPVVCKRNMLGPKILTNFKINKEDKCLVKFIEKKK